MKIEHIAIWVDDLDAIKNFYMNYFNMICGPKYVNKTKGFSSYFLSFGKKGARIEIMNKTDIEKKSQNEGTVNGLAHFAISVGSKKAVDKLTSKIRQDGYIVLSEPRTTGDGYYESVILDPESNQIEITE